MVVAPSGVNSINRPLSVACYCAYATERGGGKMRALKFITPQRKRLHKYFVGRHIDLKVL